MLHGRGLATVFPKRNRALADLKAHPQFFLSQPVFEASSPKGLREGSYRCSYLSFPHSSFLKVAIVSPLHVAGCSSRSTRPRKACIAGESGATSKRAFA